MNEDSSIHPKKITGKLCACPGCKNAGFIALEMKVIEKKSLYCNQCATDLMWHGVAALINDTESPIETEGESIVN